MFLRLFENKKVYIGARCYYSCIVILTCKGLCFSRRFSVSPTAERRGSYFIFSYIQINTHDFITGVKKKVKSTPALGITVHCLGTKELWFPALWKLSQRIDTLCQLTKSSVCEIDPAIWNFLWSLAGAGAVSISERQKVSIVLCNEY